MKSDGTSSAQNLRVRDLTDDYVRAHMDALIDIASDVPHEYWQESHFLSDLPMKWALSFVVEQEEVPVAYAVLSRKGASHGHLHHFMVHRDWRRLALGSGMIEEMERRSRDAGLNRITLKIADDNKRGHRFYERYGYVRASAAGGYTLLEKQV